MYAVCIVRFYYYCGVFLFMIRTKPYTFMLPYPFTGQIN
jgi:hypothetical protein